MTVSTFEFFGLQIFLIIACAIAITAVFGSLSVVRRTHWKLITGFVLSCILQAYIVARYAIEIILFRIGYSDTAPQILFWPLAFSILLLLCMAAFLWTYYKENYRTSKRFLWLPIIILGTFIGLENGYNFIQNRWYLYQNPVLKISAIQPATDNKDYPLFFIFPDNVQENDIILLEEYVVIFQAEENVSDFYFQQFDRRGYYSPIWIGGGKDATHYEYLYYKDTFFELVEIANFRFIVDKENNTGQNMYAIVDCTHQTIKETCLEFIDSIETAYME